MVLQLRTEGQVSVRLKPLSQDPRLMNHDVNDAQAGQTGKHQLYS